MYRWFAVETYFDVDNSDILNTLVWNFISHVLSSVYLLFVRDEDLQVSDFVTTRGHRERWLYFYANIIIIENRAETLKCSIVTIRFLNISGYKWIC